jgi:hypothetical protein
MWKSCTAGPGCGILGTMPWWFSFLTLGAWILVVALALLTRGRQFATFAGVIGGLHSLIAAEIAPMFVPVMPVFVALHIAVYVNFLMLTRARMRPLWYRLLVSWPGSFFWAGTLLALPWAVVRALGFSPWGIVIPYALAAIGMVQSFVTREEEIDLVVRDHHIDHAQPLPHPHGKAREDRPLRIVQISDPHLGPFMSVSRLRRIAESAVKKSPDLICLTGDFLTMESHSDPELLRRSLEPLAALKGRVFACHGNHDHEAPETVRKALAANGIILLVDDAALVDTEAGPRSHHRNGLCLEPPSGANAASLSAASAHCRNHPHHHAARSGRVQTPAGGRGRSGPVRAHPRWSGWAAQPRAFVDFPAAVRDQDS